MRLFVTTFIFTLLCTLGCKDNAPKPSDGPTAGGPPAGEKKDDGGVALKLTLPVQRAPNFMVFAPDSQTVAINLYFPDLTGKLKEVLQISRPVEQQTISQITDPGDLIPLAFSADQKLLAGRSGREIQIRKVATGELVSKLTVEPSWPDNAAAFSPDGTQLAVAILNPSSITNRVLGGLTLWDLTTGKLLGNSQSDPLGRIDAIAFSPNGKQIATVQQAAYRVFDMPSLGQAKSERPIDCADDQMPMKLTADGQTAAWASHGKAWIMKSGEEPRLLADGLSTDRIVGFSQDGNVVVTLDRVQKVEHQDAHAKQNSQSEVTQLNFRDVKTGNVLASRNLDDAPGGLDRVATRLSPDGKTAILWAYSANEVNVRIYERTR